MFVFFLGRAHNKRSAVCVCVCSTTCVERGALRSSLLVAVIGNTSLARPARAQQRPAPLALCKILTIVPVSLVVCVISAN